MLRLSSMCHHRTKMEGTFRLPHSLSRLHLMSTGLYRNLTRTNNSRRRSSSTNLCIKHRLYSNNTRISSRNRTSIIIRNHSNHRGRRGTTSRVQSYSLRTIRRPTTGLRTHSLNIAGSRTRSSTRPHFRRPPGNLLLSGHRSGNTRNHVRCTLPLLRRQRRNVAPLPKCRFPYPGLK